MIELKTSKALLDKLKRFSSKSLSHDTIAKQRSSFVYGVLSSDNNMTKEQVENAIARQEGEYISA